MRVYVYKTLCFAFKVFLSCVAVKLTEETSNGNTCKLFMYATDKQSEKPFVVNHLAELEVSIEQLNRTNWINMT